MTITNFGSGEIEIVDENGAKVRLDRESANRLIMTARMHTVAEFVEKVPSLIPSPELIARLLESFRKAPTSSDKWNLKEKLARLGTLTKGYVPKNSAEVVESVQIE